jgi:Predicted metal-sulfur cluster biosynthetic enzyme
MTDESSNNAPQWDIDRTHPQFHKALIASLASITDPELGYTILELGLIRNLSIENDTARVVMILTTPFCPYGPSMLESARAQVEQVLGMPLRLNMARKPGCPR